LCAQGATYGYSITLQRRSSPISCRALRSARSISFERIDHVFWNIAAFAGSLIQGGGALGSLIVGRLLDRVGMISIVMAFIISMPFVVLIGAVAMPEYLLMTTVFISGMCLLGGQIGLNALAGTIYPTFVRSSGAGSESWVRCAELAAQGSARGSSRAGRGRNSVVPTASPVTVTAGPGPTNYFHRFELYRLPPQVSTMTQYH
jgi:MFS family permease